MDAADTPSMCDPEHWHERAMRKMEQGNDLQFPLRVAVQMWPAPGTGTPVATPHSQMLRETWLTPTANDAKPAGAKETAMMALYESGQNVPDTYKRLRSQVGAREDAAARTCQGGENFRTSVGGQLNPTWVEWLMGWPLGWTDLRASAMDKFQQWRRSHGIV